MKILVIRLSSIGDIVICTPVIRALHKQLDGEVHVLTKSVFVSVLDNNPYITETHIYEEVRKLEFDPLINEEYDLIVDLHKNYRSGEVRRKLGVRSLSFDKLNIPKWLLVNFKWDLLPNGKHLVDRYFEALASIGLENDGEGLDFFISEELVTLPKGPFAAVAMGAAHATKMIPEKVLKEIISKLDLPVVLIGGPGEKSLGESLTDSRDEVMNLAGHCSIQQSAFAISRSKFLISPDTGMMHIGAALKKPVAVVWGNTVPSFGMFPYYGVHSVPHYYGEVRLNCRPCSKIGFGKCPKGHFKCMYDQDVKALIDWCKNLGHSTS